MKRIEPIEWLRGIAALWVFGYHANLLTMSGKYFDRPSVGSIAEWGHHGVEVFFVLSGFVMAVSVPRTARNDWQGLRRYAVRRIFRIFPAYLVVFVPLTVVAFVTGLGTPTSGSVSDFVLANALLLPRDDQTSFVPIVAWTLVHELMFYAVFALAFVRRWLAIGALGMWGGLCLAAHLTGTPQGWQMQLSLLNLLFLAGVALAQVAGDRIGSPRVGHRLWTAPLSILGRWSYGLYLVHYPVLVAIAMALTKLGWPAWAMWILGFIVSLGAAGTLYLLVEKPGIKAGKRLSAMSDSNIRPATGE